MKSFVNCAIYFIKHKSFFLQILHQSSVPSNITPLCIFSSNIIYFVQKKPIKEQIFETFKCLGQNSSNLKRQVSSTSNFASFFIVMAHNSSVNFKLIHFLLWIKGSHQSSSFETFECSGKNLPNSSCHFPNHESVFVQILH